MATKAPTHQICACVCAVCVCTGTGVHNSRQGSYHNHYCVLCSLFVSHSGRYWANISDTLISGSFRQWREGGTEAIEYSVGDTIQHLVGEAAAVQWSQGTWMVEYGRGFVPSTLGFALSDTFFSTQDFYVLYRIIRIYIISLSQEMLQGNF